MKLLSGAELAGYIKERQAKQVRGLRQTWKVFPKLVIVQTVDSPVIDTYVRLKKSYGEDILIEVELRRVSEDEAVTLIDSLNQDDTVHGIIVQLPLEDPNRTDELLEAVLPEKDVDALGAKPIFDAATPMAINWLLAGYAVDLTGKHIVIVGEGRLVGAPLAKMWHASGYTVTVISEPTDQLTSIIQSADVVVTATGTPGLITSDMLRPDTVVVDAGTSSEGGMIVGDVAADVRERHDLTITPEKGGVGPLTVCALFENVIRSARLVANQQDQASS
jgi:methylenetetrahydrofolate dehydrogenase (NADP+)/methenyltetrahydrofolate cyclohydrolase